MSGVYVIRYLLVNAAAVVAVVPAARIKNGVVPLNTATPSISVNQISSVPTNLIRTNETPKLHTDRVQVTAIHSDYGSLKALMALILAACPSQRGSVNSISVDSIQPESEGPDLFDPTTNTYECSRDFIVRWLQS